MTAHTFRIEKLIDSNPVVLYPTLIQAKGNSYLVDCGYEETYEEFVDALYKLGVRVGDLHAILISHDDIDHVGALRRFKDDNPSLLIYCSQTEEPAISGRVKSERLIQAEANLPALKEEYRPWAIRFVKQLESIPRIPVDLTFTDGEWIENEIQVISTPGHTRGHVSFYLSSHKTLIANDALVVEHGTFDLANPQFTLDLEQAVRSIERIREIGAETIVCYHGGTTSENILERLTLLIDQYKKNQTHQ